MTSSPMDQAIATLDRLGAPPEAAKEVLGSWGVMGYVNPDHDCQPPGFGRKKHYTERPHRRGRRSWARAWVCECGAVWQTYLACAGSDCVTVWRRTGHVGDCPKQHQVPSRTTKRRWWPR